LQVGRVGAHGERGSQLAPREEIQGFARRAAVQHGGSDGTARGEAQRSRWMLARSVEVGSRSRPSGFVDGARF